MRFSQYAYRFHNQQRAGKGLRVAVAFAVVFSAQDRE
jgi:hypothetical protein